MKRLSVYPTAFAGRRRHFSAGFFISATCTGLIALLFYANPHFSKGWTVPLAWGFWWLSIVQFLFILIMLTLR